MTRLVEVHRGESARGVILEIRRFIRRYAGDKVGLHPVQYEYHQFQGDVKEIGLPVEAHGKCLFARRFIKRSSDFQRLNNYLTQRLKDARERNKGMRRFTHGCLCGCINRDRIINRLRHVFGESKP